MTMGFGRYTQSVPTGYVAPHMILSNFTTGVKGTLQEFMPTSDLKKIDLSKTDLVVGEDNHLYSPRFGLIECLAVVKTPEDDSKIYVDRIDWNSYPPMGELAYLFNIFFKDYDREVLMLVGRKRDHSGWIYHVPQQVGSPALVTWTADDEEMGIFSDEAQWIGTIHIHPGSDCTPSQTDIDDWAEPEKSGLHLIFGRDGSYAIYGSIAGSTFKVFRGLLGGIVRSPVTYTTSRGRSLKVLLTKPKPRPLLLPKVKIRSWKDNSVPFDGTDMREFITSRGSKSYVERNLDIMRISPIGHDELQSLRMVSHGGRYYILTEVQYAHLGALCQDVCPLPTVGSLVIRSVNQGEERSNDNTSYDKNCSY